MGGGQPPSYHPSSTESPNSPSSRSTESMVEILHPVDDGSSSTSKLLYSKSKVYVQPTSFTKDNIEGFAAIVEQREPRKILLSWIPESMARSRRDYESFLRAERGELGGNGSGGDDDYVLVQPIPERGESYAFSVPLSSVYSIIVYPPSLSKWYGSLTINLMGGQTLPTLHFRDDESASTLSLLASPRSSTSPPTPTWGGEDFLQRLRVFAHLLRSQLEPNLFLVNPNREDTELHSTLVFDDSAVDDILSPVPAHQRPRPSSSTGGYPPSTSSTPTPPNFPPPSIVHNPRTSILSGFAQITRAATNLSTALLSHPSVSPHLPAPVRTLIHADSPTFTRWSNLAGTGEYDGARTYLAKWARLVAEEGERAKRAEISGVEGIRADDGSGAGELGVWEVLRVTNGLGEERTTREKGRPVGWREWDEWWDHRGWPLVEESYFRGEVFKRGIDPSLRATAWPFLLGVVPWKSTLEERTELWSRKSQVYHALRTSQTINPEVRAKPEIVEEIHRIDVDCRRTDRGQTMFAIPKIPAGEVGEGEDQEEGGKSASNEHVDKLAEILLTYVLFEKDLGYVQGMSDLAAPLYVVMEGEEVATFWCFVEFMERMKQNFLRDQSGMKQQLLTLQQLISVMDPELYRHLEKTESLNLFFCFRWILIAFKREFGFEEIIGLWENLFTNHLTPHFLLFFALAVLHSHRDVILRYLAEFDEILKYCNDLSGCIELESTIAQAEVLFLSFKALVADVDRRQAARDAAKITEGLHRRKPTGGGGASTPPVASSSSTPPTELDRLEVPNLPLISQNLRDLLG
ncbi:rab-GTPase-TBC domain-containing protein [Mrakia frigida]|uniref:TBC domain-containing protein n=1 Tax=Mrakia frigida TaxID=29902 RepID=UPI003FCBF0BD